MDASKELRASSDSLLDDLAVLAGLEDQKRSLLPGSPELVSLAEEIERIARRVLGASLRQRQLTEQVSEIADSGPGTATDLPSIEETPREIHLILADWREAERRAQESAPGSNDAATAIAEVERLRREYRIAHEYARKRRG